MAGAGKRNWRSKAPRTARERRAVLRRGGPQCFLDPKGLKFPVCPRASPRPTCQGVNAARLRAQLNRNPRIVKAAERLGFRLGCHRAGKAGR